MPLKNRARIVQKAAGPLDGDPVAKGQEQDGDVVEANGVDEKGQILTEGGGGGEATGRVVEVGVEAAKNLAFAADLILRIGEVTLGHWRGVVD